MMNEPAAKKSTDLQIKCQHCGGRATYQNAFKSVRSPEGYDPAHVHPFGSTYVVERFPSMIAWVVGTRSYSSYGRGVASCEDCRATYVVDLVLPEHLYYRWMIRGKLLYAYNRDHAVDLLDYVESTDRDLKKYGYQAALWLKRTPKEFLSAKVRDEVVKKIRKSLKEG
ncbi:MAG: hypothetical protein U0670_10165 [Anaerolineae bacterium]